MSSSTIFYLQLSTGSNRNTHHDMTEKNVDLDKQLNEIGFSVCIHLGFSIGLKLS